MKKAIQQDTLEALISDQALREIRAVRIEGGGRYRAAWGRPGGPSAAAVSSAGVVVTEGHRDLLHESRHQDADHRTLASTL